MERTNERIERHNNNRIKKEKKRTREKNSVEKCHQQVIIQCASCDSWAITQCFLFTKCVCVCVFVGACYRARASVCDAGNQMARDISSQQQRCYQNMGLNDFF